MLPPPHSRPPPPPRLLFLLQLTAIALFANFAIAFDPAKDIRCPSKEGICLSSFIWCARTGDTGGRNGCHYPDGADAFFPGTDMAYAVLYHNRQYEISWRQAVPDVPVEIEWLFSRELYYSVEGGFGELEVMWSTTTTNSSCIFDPREILMSFPTPHAPNVSQWQAIAGSHDVSNHIRISQPNASTEAGREPMISDQFLVHTDWTHQFMHNVQEHDFALWSQQQRTWQLGVGAGIGIGMPILILVAAFLGHRLGTKAGFEMAEKAARRRGL